MRELTSIRVAKDVPHDVVPTVYAYSAASG